MGRLDGNMGMSADGLGEECSEEIRTVNEFRVVAIPGDAVIVGVLSYSSGVYWETRVASLARVRAERLRLEDTIVKLVTGSRL